MRRFGLELGDVMTPWGRSGASATVLAMKWAVCATCPGSLMTAVQPAASAGASERIVSTTGEFHGAMMPATPIGWRRISEMLPGFGVMARPVSRSAAAA